MSKAHKETTVKEADKKAQDAKSKSECEAAIIKEAMRLYNKEEHSVQQMFAYCRQMQRYSKK